jgi:hypothetical protein
MARSKGSTLTGGTLSLVLGLAGILTIQTWMPYWIGFWQGFADILIKAL